MKNDERFRFHFDYPNANQKLFGTRDIPLIDRAELRNMDMMQFINNRLRQTNSAISVPNIPARIKGLTRRYKLMPHQQRE